MKKYCFLIVVMFFLGIVSSRAQFTDLVNFSGTSGSYLGAYPQYDSLVVSGNVAYGMTVTGGSFNYGCIFSVNTNGKNYTILHNFTGSTFDGEDPAGSLTLSGNTLYGMTAEGGSSIFGTIFTINTNGGGFTVLHDFTGNSSDGSYPRGNLTLSGSILYGMTPNGGPSNDGIIFSIKSNGSSFTIIHNFTGSSSDGTGPIGSLTLSGNTLYGMTAAGGSGNDGIIFSIDTNGNSFTDLHNFIGTSSDGASPYGGLTLSGSKLYGMTYYGGSSNYGIVFSINTNGSSFTDLHNFTGSSSDGEQPEGSLTLSGNMLYGMTLAGGSSTNGVIFSIDTNGSSFTDLHNFTGSSSDGANPLGSLTLSGNTLYGMAQVGGDSNEGIIFSLKDTIVTTSTNQLTTLGQINIFPNPSTGQFTLSLSNVSEKCNVEVYNVLGKRVKSEELRAKSEEIDLIGQPNGIYLYRVITENGGLVGEGKLILLR